MPGPSPGLSDSSAPRRARWARVGTPWKQTLLRSYQPQYLEGHPPCAAQCPLEGAVTVFAAPQPCPQVPPRAAAPGQLCSSCGHTRIRPTGPRRGRRGRSPGRRRFERRLRPRLGWDHVPSSSPPHLCPMDALCGSGELGSKFWVRRGAGTQGAPRRAPGTASGRGPFNTGRGSDRAAQTRRDLPCPVRRRRREELGVPGRSEWSLESESAPTCRLALVGLWG